MATSVLHRSNLEYFSHLSSRRLSQRRYQILIGTDASPTHLGRWLMLNGEMRAFFSDAITTMDEDLFNVQRGTHIGQQLWEFLALLVALRLWVDPSEAKSRSLHAQTKSVQLEVKGDSIGSLSLALRLRPKGPKMAIVAREIAFILVHMCSPSPQGHPQAWHRQRVGGSTQSYSRWCKSILCRSNNCVRGRAKVGWVGFR